MNKTLTKVSLNKKNLLRNLNKIGNLPKLLLLLVIIIIVMSIIRPNLFLTVDNLQSMAYQFPEYGLLAIGVMLTLVSAGIDLSVVGIANLSGISAAMVMKAIAVEGASEQQIIFSIVISIAVSLIVAAVCGLFNGFLISKIKIPAMLATMGSMLFFTGVSNVITMAKSVTGIPEKFTEIGTYAIFGIIPVPVVVFLVAVIVVGFIMSRTTFGLRLFMMGTNSNAARYAGLNNTSIILRTYMMSGMLASFTGLIMLARMFSIRSDFGISYTMQAVLVAILGGTDPLGGRGTVSGVVIAVLILQCLSSGLNMFPDLSSYIKEMAWGITLVLVMITNHLTSRRTASAQSR